MAINTRVHLNDREGLIHAEHPETPDHFLCGLNFGKGDETRDKINCPACISVIRFCKSIGTIEYDQSAPAKRHRG